MQKIELFLFDLDGTLIDSKQDIANSVNYTMKQVGLPLLSDEKIYEFVGNGVTPLIRQSVEAGGGVSFDEALKIFMEHYKQHLLDHTQPFDGIFEVLEHFKNIPKVVVTNKSQKFSEMVIEGLKLTSYFEGIYGGDTEFPKKPDPKVVHHLLETFQSRPEQTVIVGDSQVDMKTGAQAGILRCAASYGLRPLAELKEAGYDYLIDAPRDLLKIFH